MVVLVVGSLGLVLVETRSSWGTLALASPVPGSLRMRNLLPISYAILFAFLAAAIGGYLCGAKQEIGWLRDLSLNVGTEVFGIVLTVFLIDAVIRRNEVRERRRVRRVAFQQLRIPLIHHLTVLQQMYKAAIFNPPERQPVEVRELFTDSYFVQVAFLDFSKPAPVDSVVPLQWFDWLRMEATNFKAALGRTIEKYATFLEGGSVELLEGLINSHFLSLLIQVPAVRDTDIRENTRRSYNVLSGEGMVEFVREYVDKFSSLVELYNAAVLDNEKVRMDDQFWRNDIAPVFGSGRLSGG